MKVELGKITTATVTNMNLELYKQITFDEFIEHGRINGANIVNGVPWSWRINGKAVTHERDDLYLIEVAKEGWDYMESEIKPFGKDDKLMALEHGLHIFPYREEYETHCPGSCPL